MDCCYNPPANDGEQTKSLIVFVCLSNDVKFVVGIISIYFFWKHIRDISPSQQLHIYCGLNLTF